MNWISLDWDFVTGDCRKPGNHNRCIMNCSGCGDTGNIGRGNIGSGYTSWKYKLEQVKKYIVPSILFDCIVRDNHGDIFQFLKPGDEVLNYDYHTDDYEYIDGVQEDNIYCWNWVNHCDRNDIKVTSCYSTDDLCLIDKSKIYNLFVAWSTPYTRQDLDGHLFRFLMELGIPVILNG